VGTELERAGRVRPASYPWALEGTAILAMFAALPLALWLGMRFPFERGRWRAALAAHLAGVMVFAAIQIALMSGLRIALWPALYGAGFDFGDSALGVFVYEFRKQAASYVGFQFILATSRGLEQLRLEAAAARAEARTRHRVTLKSGGRTFHAEADGFIAARAAGNYVEARFGDREHLARMTLTELEALLREAGI